MEDKRLLQLNKDVLHWNHFVTPGSFAKTLTLKKWAPRLKTFKPLTYFEIIITVKGLVTLNLCCVFDAKRNSIQDHKCIVL